MKLTRVGIALLIGASFAAGCVVAPGGGGFAASTDEKRDQVSGKWLNLFDDVVERIRADYVEPVPGRTLIENALNGMLTGLDPHSAYMNQQQYHDMQTETSGAFGGIGLELTDKDGMVQVVSPIDGTPAAEAGIQPGDLITSVDGKSLLNVNLDDAVARMRGPPNSRLSLTIKRQDVATPIVVTLVRRIIKIETVKSQLIGDIGVIRISEFTERTNPGVRAAVKSLRTQAGGHLQGLLLDLRNDPGGLLDQAIAVSNDFLDHGVIVSTRGRHPDDNESWSAKPNEDLSGNLPIVVLTNNGTASAAEIVAGALQDDRRGLVLGTQSFGKGSVQTIFPLPGNGAIRLTTARYYTPSGRSIQGLGVTPNVEVAETSKPVPHFGPEHESDLRHILANTDGNGPGGDSRGDSPGAPTLDLPPAAQHIPKAPPADWPALDPKKPATDFQLQQGLMLVHAMAERGKAASR